MKCIITFLIQQWGKEDSGSSVILKKEAVKEPPEAGSGLGSEKSDLSGWFPYVNIVNMASVFTCAWRRRKGKRAVIVCG